MGCDFLCMNLLLNASWLRVTWLSLENPFFVNNSSTLVWMLIVDLYKD